MPKEKLTIKKTDLKKFKVAAHYTDTKIGEELDLGDEVVIETTYRNGGNLVKLGQYMSKVTGNELKEAEKAK